MSVESFIRNRATYYTSNIDGYKYVLHFDESSSDLLLSVQKKIPFLPIYRSTQDDPVFVCSIDQDAPHYYRYKSAQGTVCVIAPGLLYIMLMADLIEVADAHVAFKIMKQLRRL